MRSKYSIIILFILSGLTLPAYAYIDPGSGSLLLQFLIAGIVAVFFKFKNHLRKLIIFIRKKFNR